MTDEKLEQEIAIVAGEIEKERQWLINYVNGHDTALSGMAFEICKNIATRERLLTFLKEMKGAT